MLYRFLIISVLLTGISTLQASGQVTGEDDVTINVQANVLQSIELITVSNIRLRDFPPGANEVYISPVENPYAGHMVAVGNPNAEIRIEYLPSRELTQVNGNGLLSFQYEIAGSAIDNQITSEILLNDNRNFRFNAQGRFYLWIGGRVDISNAKPGSYEGEFTIEIEYI
jgi:hypothetical protein